MGNHCVKRLWQGKIRKAGQSHGKQSKPKPAERLMPAKAKMSTVPERLKHD